MTLKDSILLAGAVMKTETVEAFGMTITIRELDTGTATHLGKSLNNEDKDALIQWFIECVVDPETQKKVFSEDDIPTIRGMRFADVSKVAMAGIRLNKLDPEDTAKNSAASPNAASDSD